MFRAAVVFAVFLSATSNAVTPIDQIISNVASKLDKIESYSANATILQCYG